MQGLNLKQSLKRLGIRKLVSIVGEAQLSAINEIFDSPITESTLVDMLILRYGNQILTNQEVRSNLLHSLTSDYKNYIINGIFEEKMLTHEEEEALKRIKWSRNSKKVERVLNIFSLDNSYLSPIYQGKPDKIDVEPDVFLFPYQRRVKDKLTRLLIKEENRVLVHMPTGAGKTRTSIEALIDYWRTYSDRSGFLLWLAHSEELCEQAVETFEKIWRVRGDSPITIYRTWGRHETPDFGKDSGIIVASFQKLYSMITSAENNVFIQINKLKNNCGIILIDEAHKVIAPTYKQSLDFISNENTKIVGLTATPGRETQLGEVESFSETKELIQFFHGNKISIVDENGKDIEDPIFYLQSEGYLSKISRKAVKTNIKYHLNENEKNWLAQFLEIPTSVLKKLADDSQRNTLILNEIAEVYLRGESCIVFALSVEHAYLLNELLFVKGVPARCVDGDTSEQDRAAYIEGYKKGEIKVLLNYGVLTTGFDAPITKAVIITRPTASLVLYSQMVGRGIRGPKMGGNEICLLIDLKDNLEGFPDERQAFNYYNDLWKAR